MNWDSPLVPLAELRWSVVQDLLADLEPKRVLEIGCGQGAFGARMARDVDYLGVEADPTSGAVARSRIEPIGGRVICGTPDLIDPNERFDLVCAFEVIEHLEDDVSTLKDWVRWAAPNGTVALSAPAWPERFGAWDQYVGHYRRYTPAQLDSSLRSAGCVEVRHVVYGWPLGFVTERARNEIAKHRSRRGQAESISARTAASGRRLQPKRLIGFAVRVGVTPFAALQKVHPSVGIGVVSVGTTPPIPDNRAGVGRGDVG